MKILFGKRLERQEEYIEGLKANFISQAENIEKLKKEKKSLEDKVSFCETVLKDRDETIRTLKKEKNDNTKYYEKTISDLKNQLELTNREIEALKKNVRKAHTLVAQEDVKKRERKPKLIKEIEKVTNDVIKDVKVVLDCNTTTAPKKRGRKPKNIK